MDINTNTLYRKNNFNQPCFWRCFVNDDETLCVQHGIVGKMTHTEIINTNRKVEDEVKSRINAKRKVGYKYISELTDNNYLPVEGELLSYLNTYLTDYRTSVQGDLLPMLAKTYNVNIWNKESIFCGQYKINGLRCFISAELDEINLFKPIRLKFQSREGTYWNTLYDLEDYLLSVIDKDLLNEMVEEHYILDGELYIPGCTVNEINHCVKNSNAEKHNLIQYWCYDIAVADFDQTSRFKILLNYQTKFIKSFNSIESHLNNTEKLVILDNIAVYSNEGAIKLRDKFIDLGFEGLILRNPNDEYQFGKRNKSMIKYKRTTDGKFTVIDIYPEGIKRPDIPLLLCKNDINDKTFEVHVNGSMDYQRSILKEKEKFIGKTLFITYGERSGVDKLPFHVKEVYFIN